MPIAADIGYGHGPEHPSQGEAHDMTFGCFKASPRYHLRRFEPSYTGPPRPTAPRRSPRPDDRARPAGFHNGWRAGNVRFRRQSTPTGSLLLARPISSQATACCRSASQPFRASSTVRGTSCSPLS
jgi:hypothetical protein